MYRQYHQIGNDILHVRRIPKYYKLNYPKNSLHK